MDTIVSQMATLSVAVTSESVDTGMAPNINIHNLDRRAQDIADFTGIDMILYAPIVETMDMTGWQQYASESSQRWIAQDYVSESSPSNSSLHFEYHPHLIACIIDASEIPWLGYFYSESDDSGSNF